MRKFLFAFVMILLMASCRASKIPVEVVSKDTVYISRESVDSIYLHDSVWYETIIKGDTVWKTKELYRDRWHDRYVHDTTYISRCDTITRKVVTNELTKRQQREIRIGRMAIVLALAACLLLLLNFILKRKK